MIWHIFKKDCRLLRFGIYGAASAHAVSAALWIVVGPFESTSQLAGNASLASYVALLSMILLIAAAVHQDTPALRGQDWLIRPIKRRDLMLAKILFALLAAHGPLFVFDLVEALVYGFPLLASLGAALARGSSIFFWISLPTMALATMTRSLTGWMGAALGILIGLIVIGVALQTWGLLQPPPYRGTGFEWIAASATLVLIVIAASVILPLQYLRRRSLSALATGVSYLALTALPALLPWNTALSIQRRTASEPAAGSSVALSFDPVADRISAGQVSSDVNGITQVHLPLRVSGMPGDGLLLIDNATVRFVDDKGAAVYSGENNCIRIRPPYGRGTDCTRQNFRVRPEAGTGEARIYYPIAIPTHIYTRMQTQPVRLEVDYYLSLLSPSDVGPVERTPQQWPSGERLCAQRVGRGLGEVELRCLNTVALPACVRFVAETKGQRVSESTRCEPNYAPQRFNMFPDIIRRPGGFVASSVESSGYAAGGLPSDYRVIVETYRARSHFKRELSIKDMRLTDWTMTRTMDRSTGDGDLNTPWMPLQ